MKLGKDEIQKIALSSLLLIGLLYCYFALLLGPLSKREAQVKEDIKALTPQIDTAKKQIAHTASLEKEEPANNVVLDQIKGLIPDGAPVAWFPPRIADFFKRQGIEKCSARLTNELPLKDVPGFRKLVWSIDVPKVGFIPLAIALSGLENEDPLLEISNLQVEANSTNPELQHVVLTANTIVTK